MKISLEWISDHVTLPVDRTPRQIAHDLTLKTVEVEEVENVDGDVVLEIDNKSLTNRPDLWGHYGIAREFAAIYGLPLHPLPEFTLPEPSGDLVGELDPTLCRRFSLLEFTADNTLPTPGTVRRRLEHIGESTVNLLVDLSNYVMFAVGQPNHVWDSAKIRLPVGATFSAQPTRLALVAGEDVEITSPVPVIGDAVGIIGLAGSLGGQRSSVCPASTRFLLETATFNAQPVRRASQQLGLRTEASARYEKGLDTQRVDASIALFLTLLREADPASRAHRFQDVVGQPTPVLDITVERSFLDRRIGITLTDTEITQTLTALGFQTALTADAVQATVPSWRATGDVSLPHDVLEELARIHGYDQLPSAQTSIVLAPVRSLKSQPLDRSMREELALRGGLQEVVTYPWVHDEMLEVVGHPKERTILFEGASSPDHNAMRPLLLPNLLEAIESNLRYRKQFGIFELGTVFPEGPWEPAPTGREELPEMPKSLALALVGPAGEMLFRQAKGHLEALRRRCFLDDLALEGSTEAPWAERTARLAISAGGVQVGSLGLLRPQILRKAGIQGVMVAYAELDLTTLTAKASRDNAFVAIPDLPGSDFDLSLMVDDDITWDQIAARVVTVDDLIDSVSFVDEYRAPDLAESSRSITFRVRLQPRLSTLTRDDISRVRSELMRRMEQEFGAALR
ncbi:MAG: phenylalanine--tRNA ligase subunit beta [Dermatophilaceae bacterium]